MRALLGSFYLLNTRVTYVRLLDKSQHYADVVSSQHAYTNIEYILIYTILS